MNKTKRRKQTKKPIIIIKTSTTVAFLNIITVTILTQTIYTIIHTQRLSYTVTKDNKTRHTVTTTTIIKLNNQFITALKQLKKGIKINPNYSSIIPYQVLLHAFF